jgi:hypothetical protein
MNNQWYCRLAGRLVGLGSLAFALCAFAFPARATLVPPAMPLEYVSPAPFYLSGIVTSEAKGGTGFVWGPEFANFVNSGIGGNYNEIAFGFMECYGGGMIGALGPLNLVPASYTSASRWNECSFNYNAPPAVAGNLYNKAFAPVAASAPPPPPPVGPPPPLPTMMQAALAGQAGDIAGPPLGLVVSGKTYLEHPQYTSSGPIGDSITLDRNNPNPNTTNNTNYLAILFGGSVANDANLNSLKLMYTQLIARGYAANQIYVLYPGGMTPGNVVPVNAAATAANLKAAWTDFANKNTSLTTQIYYWNSGEHGTWMFDLVGLLKSVGQVIANGITYAFNLISSFVSQLQSIYSFYLGAPQASLQLPFVEVATQSVASGLTAELNGDPLALIPGSGYDLYGDGSEFDYYFALTPSDVAALSTTDSFSLSWNGADPGFELAGLTMGDAPDDAFAPPAVPEPPTLWVLATGLLALALTRRHKAA